jgi:opacity protein-like surface antigen
MRCWIAIVMIVCMMGTAVHAQDAQQSLTECETLLSEAEGHFGAGRFYDVPALLQGCIESNSYSREEQVRVYMLLTQVYLLSDDPDNAEASYLKLLHADPEFVASESVDPIDVVYLSKKFTTRPVFTPHFRIGPNLATQAVIHEMDPFLTTNQVRIKRKPQPGITVGAGIEWNINDNLGIGGEALFTYASFRTDYSNIFGNDNLAVIERQFWADFPFYVRYGYHLGKVRPYAYAGYAINLLVGDQLNLSYSEVLGSEVTPVEGPNVGVMDKRQLFNTSMVFGGGIKYKFGRNFLLFDLRYTGGLTNVVNEATNPYNDTGTFEISTLTSRYTFIGPLFRTNSYTLSFGFVRPLYDPHKVLKVKTSGVSRKLSRK